MNQFVELKDLVGDFRFAARYKKNGKRSSSERGDCLKTLADLTGYTIPRLAARTEHFKEPKDYYFLISSMKDLVATGRKTSHKHALNSLLFVEKLSPTTICTNDSSMIE